MLNECLLHARYSASLPRINLESLSTLDDLENKIKDMVSDLKRFTGLLGKTYLPCNLIGIVTEIRTKQNKNSSTKRRGQVTGKSEDFMK